MEATGLAGSRQDSRLKKKTVLGDATGGRMALEPISLEPRVSANHWRSAHSPSSGLCKTKPSTFSLDLPPTSKKEVGGDRHQQSRQVCKNIEYELFNAQGDGKRQGVNWPEDHLVSLIQDALTDGFLSKFTTDMGHSLKTIVDVFKDYSRSLQEVTNNVSLFKSILPLSSVSKKIEILFSSNSSFHRVFHGKNEI